jgi:hypothetical protein
MGTVFSVTLSKLDDLLKEAVTERKLYFSQVLYV